jgi:ribose transport system substrate-binding protein
MGYVGVNTMIAHVKGQQVEKRIDTGVVLATRENMNQQEILDRLQPDLSKWLKE